mgnify:CR=1 FL=1
MQAAIAAARADHEVTVLEREAEPGGQVRLAASVPNRAELGDMVRNQVTECRRVGVTIECGVEADVETVLARRPDHVVVAIDEIGCHHATSDAELLADRGCRVEVVTPGMVVGQDLGITLDLEQWWIRATAKGIVQSTHLVPMGPTCCCRAPTCTSATT